MRQIILDTETTGLEPAKGHRIIEIGCVELFDRRLTGAHYHVYLNPNRDIDIGARNVHGITTEFLKDKPSFASVVDDFLSFIRGDELIIHNAPFDVGFINYELQLLNKKYRPISQHCSVIDTLLLARKKHPGQRNSLDALCKRYHVDNRNRQLHGALLDANLLASVYLALTGGQSTLDLEQQETLAALQKRQTVANRGKQVLEQLNLPIVKASSETIAQHEAFISKMTNALWSKNEV